MTKQDVKLSDLHQLRNAFQEVNNLCDVASFAASCCDKPEDRLYHAEDGSWWRRDGLRWHRADPPAGWVHVDGQ